LLEALHGALPGYGTLPRLAEAKWLLASGPSLHLNIRQTSTFGAFRGTPPPMTLDIKICGLKSDEAVAAALESGASHIGFIFFEKSPRHISIEEAARLREAARGKALAVAVTVDADDATLDAIVSGMK